MARPITEKQVKIHTEIDELNFVQDMKTFISFKFLKVLGAKRRVYKNTGEVYYFIHTDCEIII